jgi:dTDP-4-dehydrorhamnose reductase
MNVLVLGAGGLLGSNVVVAARDRGHAVAGTYHSTRPAFDVPLARLDVRDRNAFGSLLDEHDPEAVVNCAAMTDVDACEANPEEAFAVNGRAPGRLAAICSDREVAFVHVSTDYVFDGTADDPYDESSMPNPVQVYGESKLEGEYAVRERLAAGESTPLFTDQHVTPSRAGAAATTILDLLETDRSGTFHVVSRSCVTPHEFGTALCARLGADETLLETGRQADVDRPASRPRYTCLDVGKVETTLGRSQPTLEADLDAVSSLL